VIGAVDSDASVDAAAQHLRQVLIDVDVGLHRTGCRPDDAERLAGRARSRGLVVRGVMGYEGHAVHVLDRPQREAACGRSMATLEQVHRRVGGDIISAGGTGTWDCNGVANEVQAGSYALMDTAYARLELPFRQALFVSARVIHVSAGYAVADCGLKALGMDEGFPTIDDAEVIGVTDEHVTFRPTKPPRFGDYIRVRPAHVDPTVAYHERMHVVEGEVVVEVWPIDMRGW
jgi:D-serine deaminase-like pyridoxal phosphate-dependent protein